MKRPLQFMLQSADLLHLTYKHTKFASEKGRAVGLLTDEAIKL